MTVAEVAAPPLEARALHRFFHAGDEETLALRGVSMTVGAGEVVAVTGPSGSGKSTLLACLAGLDEPDGGTVLVDGRRLSRRGESERAAIRARRIGILYQQDNLVGHLSVAGNVLLARRLATGGPGPDAGRMPIDELLAACAIEHRRHALPAELSGGELARAALAVALANDPPVVLADEPTGELDEATAERVLALLAAHARRGAAVILVTHDPEVAAAADREVRLRDGQVVA